MMLMTRKGSSDAAVRNKPCEFIKKTYLQTDSKPGTPEPFVQKNMQFLQNEPAVQSVIHP
jgi:hypothetical protein